MGDVNIILIPYVKNCSLCILVGFIKPSGRGLFDYEEDKGA